MYVAATRARDLLVISGYAGDLGAKKAWGPLEQGLEGLEELPECSPAPGGAMSCAVPPRKKKTAVKPAEVTKGREELRRKMAGASTASSLHETVTALAKRAGETPEWAKGGLGLWGSEVHVMLKTLGGAWREKAPGATGDELLRLARDVLVASGRDPAACRDLAAHVASIIGSPFWLRAMRSGPPPL